MARVLRERLQEPRRFMHVVTGPRQVGKTTMVQQVVAGLTVPVRSVSADEPALRGTAWIDQQWSAARAEATRSGGVLVLDEIQKIPQWSETVKRLWDEDTRSGIQLHVVVLGSAPLLIQHGLTESLAGRFETIHVPHWTYAEMHEVFGTDLEAFIYYGGYPGAAPLVSDPQRWQLYVAQSLIETSISRDVLLLTRVDKPALLRRVFDLACRYSGQILSYTKMLGQLQDAGNTVTLAHYLHLLDAAGMVTGLQKYAGDVARRRGSSPKLQVFNTALLTAGGATSLDTVRSDPKAWGRYVESAVGAHLLNQSNLGTAYAVYYWNRGNAEVDFVIDRSGTITTIEVKSSSAPRHHPGTQAFLKELRANRTLLIGGDGIALHDFLMQPVSHWIA